MAIDTTLYAAAVPAAAYVVGDRISLGAIRGPAVVRDGYGRAILKRIAVMTDVSAISGFFKVVIKNSNWVDELSNIDIAPATAETAFAPNSSAIQQGQDLPLVPNSGWDVYLECVFAITTTSPADVFALIDIDYPAVAAIEDPTKVVGYPVTVDDIYTVSPTTAGSGTLTWNTFNVDIFKAGSKYLLTEAAFTSSATTTLGFISVSGAAGQAGLERIIPVRSSVASGLKYPLDYATPLVKGPMNLNIAVVGSATSVYAYLDFVKKSM